MKAHHALYARRRAARQVQNAQAAEAIADCPDSVMGDHGAPLGRSKRREDAPAEHRTVIQKWLDELAVILGRVARVSLDCACAESTAVASIPHRIDDAGFLRRCFQPACAGADSGAAIKMVAVDRART